MYEPPTDEGELTKHRHLFAQLKIDYLIRDYRAIRSYVEPQFSFASKNVGPPPAPDAIDRLKTLAAEIIEWKDPLANMERENAMLNPSKTRDRIASDCQSQVCQRRPLQR